MSKHRARVSTIVSSTGYKFPQLCKETCQTSARLRRRHDARMTRAGKCGCSPRLKTQRIYRGISHTEIPASDVVTTRAAGRAANRVVAIVVGYDARTTDCYANRTLRDATVTLRDATITLGGHTANPNESSGTHHEWSTLVHEETGSCYAQTIRRIGRTTTHNAPAGTAHAETEAYLEDATLFHDAATLASTCKSVVHNPRSINHASAGMPTANSGGHKRPLLVPFISRWRKSQ